MTPGQVSQVWGDGLSMVTTESAVQEWDPSADAGRTTPKFTHRLGVLSRASGRAARRVAGPALIALPPLIYAALAWHRRWITDDGMIVARTVRQILAGNGPVFNPGERVEADTSTVWTWLIAALTWATQANVYAVMMWTGLVLAPVGLLLALLGARRLHQRTSPGRLAIPLGALVILALTPFWDFATSGLEDPLIFSWLGASWWLMAGVGEDTPRRLRAAAFTVGLGWIVRPDMAMGTVCFLIALWYVARPGVRRSLSLLATAGAVPMAYQIFRMGYYGLLVPNTALAKQASTFHIGHGLVYLENFVGPYRLWIPALLLAALATILIGWRRLDRTGRACIVAATASGALMAGYVIAIGGDFMHARMLLPATFTLLLPLMAVPLPSRALLFGAEADDSADNSADTGADDDADDDGAVGVRSRRPRRFGRGGVVVLCATLLVAWTFTCAAWWRLPQQPGVIPLDGITNERVFWVDVTGVANPTSDIPYVTALLGLPTGPPHTVGWVVGQDAASQHKTLLIVLPDGGNYYPFTLSRPGASVAITGDVLGTLGATVPLSGIAIDQHGLSYALAAHLDAGPHGRVGHTEYAAPVWVIAEYTNATSAPQIPAAQLAAARKVLGCGAVAQMQRATQAPLTWGRFFSNIIDSFSLTTLRIPNNPLTAEKEFCG